MELEEHKKTLDEQTKVYLKKVIGVQQQDEEVERDKKRQENPNAIEISIKEREIQLFWERRSRDSGIWSTFLGISNFLMQSLSLINPKSERHTLVNVVYMIGSALTFGLLYLHFKKNRKTAYWAQVYLLIRNGIRMLDLENTRPYSSEGAW